MIESLLQHAADIWSRWVLVSLLESLVMLALVLMIWRLIRKRCSQGVGYFLFLLVLVKLLVPVGIPFPASWAKYTPSYWVSQLLATHDATIIDANTPAIPAAVDSPDAPTVLPPPGFFVAEPLPVTIPDASHEAPPEAVFAGLPPIPEQAGEAGAELEPSFDIPMALESTRPVPALAEQTPNENIPAASENAVPQSGALRRVPITVWLMLAWGTAVLFLMSRFLVTQRRFLKSLRDRRPLDDALFYPEGPYQKRVPVFACRNISTPAVCGVRRPVILFPEEMLARLSDEQLRWVLLHELAHVRRFDLMTAFVQRLVTMLHFFNPAVWVASHFMNQLRESACDDMALAADLTIPRRSVGDALLNIVEHSAVVDRPITGALGAFDFASSVRHRLVRLLDKKRILHTRIGAGSMILLILTTVLLVPQWQAMPTTVVVAENAVEETSQDTANDSPAKKTGSPFELSRRLVAAQIESAEQYCNELAEAEKTEDVARDRIVEARTRLMKLKMEQFGLNNRNQNERKANRAMFDSLLAEYEPLEVERQTLLEKELQQLRKNPLRAMSTEFVENLRSASDNEIAATKEAYFNGTTTLDQILDAIRRNAEIKVEIAYRVENAEKFTQEKAAEIVEKRPEDLLKEREETFKKIYDFYYTGLKEGSIANLVKARWELVDVQITITEFQLKHANDDTEKAELTHKLKALHQEAYIAASVYVRDKTLLYEAGAGSLEDVVAAKKKLTDVEKQLRQKFPDVKIDEIDTKNVDFRKWNDEWQLKKTQQEPQPIPPAKPAGDDSAAGLKVKPILISGVVVDASGKAVPDVPVRMTHYGEAGVEVKTNEAGKFQVPFSAFEKNPYVMLIASHGNLGGTAHFEYGDFAAMKKECTITLRPAVTIRGVVYDKNERPLADATVGLVSPSACLIHRTQTNAKGVYEMLVPVYENMRHSDPSMVYAFKRDEGLDYVPCQPKDNTQPFVAMLKLEGTSTSQVRLADSATVQPIAGHRVFPWLFQKKHTRETMGRSLMMINPFLPDIAGVTDENGTATLTQMPNWPSGWVRFDRTAGDSPVKYCDIQFEHNMNSEDKSINVLLQQMAAIRGKTQFENGDPAPGIRIQSVSYTKADFDSQRYLNTDLQSYYTMSDDEGNYLIHVPTASNTMLLAVDDQWSAAAKTPVIIPPRQKKADGTMEPIPVRTENFTLSPGLIISGRVTKKTDGTPVEGNIVSLRLKGSDIDTAPLEDLFYDATGISTPFEYLRSRTDANGHYSFRIAPDDLSKITVYPQYEGDFDITVNYETPDGKKYVIDKPAEAAR